MSAAMHQSSPLRRKGPRAAIGFAGRLAAVCAALIVGAILPTTAALARKAASAPATKPAGHAYFWHPEIAPSGPMVMVVSLDEQYIYVYRNGVAIGVSPISSGRPGYETPTGVYTILQKEREHRSNLYDDAPMPYMQRLTWDGVAMHGGNLPGHPASHGCIRLPPTFAEKLFQATRRGGVVVIADARVSPAAIVHPAALAPIDLAGQPAVPVRQGETDIPLPVEAGGAPLSIIISTHDRMAYVLRDGKLSASSPLRVAPDAQEYGFHGTLLYVMGEDRTAPSSRETAVRPLHQWSAYRILGSGPVPEPAQMAKQLKLPEAFGQGIQQALVPGTTVLVTDLPGQGGDALRPYASLLVSDRPTATDAP